MADGDRGTPNTGERILVRTAQRREPPDLRPYGLAVLMVAAALGAALSLGRWLDIATAPLVFIAPVIASAVHDGLGPSLLAAVLGTLAYNFFFLPPLHTFTIANPSNVVAFVVFGAVSVVTSSLAARARAQ